MPSIKKEALPSKAASVLETERIVGVLGDIVSILLDIWSAIVDWIRN